jgi:hypothetical protein
MNVAARMGGLVIRVCLPFSMGVAAALAVCGAYVSTAYIDVGYSTPPGGAPARISRIATTPSVPRKVPKAPHLEYG